MGRTSTTQIKKKGAIELPTVDDSTLAHLPQPWNWKHPDYARVFAERLKRLRRIRESGAEGWALVNAQYRDDWHSFINDWAITVDPRNIEVGLPATIPLLMFTRQEEFVTWVYERWSNQENGICDKSRASGATWLCAWIAIAMWKFLPGSNVGFGSRKEEYVDQIGGPKSIFWKIRRAIMGLPWELRPLGYEEKKHAPYMRIINPETGSTIVGEAGDNIGRGDRTSIYFVDESAHIEHPEQTDAALSETTNCRIDVSTAGGVGNSFYRHRMGGRISVFTFHWKQDPRKDDEWYAKRVEQIDDPVVVAQELDIDYTAAVTNAALEGADIERAMSTPKSAVSIEGDRYLGVDVARFGKNESVIVDRKHRAVLKLLWKKKASTETVAGWVREYIIAAGGIKKFGAVCVDDIGVGGGVTDKLRTWYGAKIVGVNVALPVDDGRNGNLRARLTWDAEKWLKDLPNHLPNDPELKAQLTSIQKEYRRGLRWIESKEDMEKRGVKSPDRADAYFLTFASPPIEDDDLDESLKTHAREILDRGVGY